MKIKKITLENFRCYENFELDFHDNLTVIVGNNGVGKTTILDAVGLLFSVFLRQLPQVKSHMASLSDIRLVSGTRKAPGMQCSMEVDLSVEAAAIDPELKEEHRSLGWSGSRLRDKSKATANAVKKVLRTDIPTGQIKIREFASRLITAQNEEKRYLMPFVAYYGTDRAVFDTPLRRRNFRTQFARFDSLSGSLNPSASFKRVFEWIHAKENEEARAQKAQRSFDYEDPELAAVRSAITQFFPEFSNPRTEIRPLRFVVDWKRGDQTITIDLNQLSDGYRTTLALVADLASRMAEANPCSEVDMDPLEAPAVVMIDEVDLHLHPKWQQEIVPKLQTVFKNAQFILTTHSPQVLTTVPHQCIRELVFADGKFSINRPEFSFGAASPVLLETIQKVDPRPQNLEIVQKLNRYKAFVSQDEWDSAEALALRTDLNEWGHGFEADLAEVDLDIRLRKFRRGKAE